MIKKISVQVRTGDSDGAGTNGHVYLGIGGREYHLQIPGNDDFEPADEVTYVFGEHGNVGHPEENDPRTGPCQHLAELDFYPAYIRLHPKGMGDSWELGRVHVRILGDEGEREYHGLPDSSTLWLGWNFGLTLHLRKG